MQVGAVADGVAPSVQSAARVVDTAYAVPLVPIQYACRAGVS